MNVSESISCQEVLCVYSPEGKLASHWEKWVRKKEGRVLLIFVESLENGSPALRASMRILELCRHDPKELLRDISWEYLFMNFSYELYPFCSSAQKKRGQILFADLEKAQLHADLLASDYRDLGAQILKNVKHNLSHRSNNILGPHLFSKFKNIPALICGAGPSLKKQLTSLKLLKQQALIFAGGSTLPILTEKRIIPHFAASIDPSAPYHRFQAHTAFEAPFFYQDRVAREILDSVQGEKIWVPGNGGYPLEQWLVGEVLSLFPPFEGGWNVSTFLTALAVQLGCTPIIFVGMDLASNGKDLYAEKFREEEGDSSGLIEVVNAQGQLVHTKKDWLMAANWLSDLVENTPQTTFLNATEGGLGFKNIPFLPFEEIKKKYLLKSHDLNGWIHSHCQAVYKCNQSDAELEEKIQRVGISFEKCDEMVRELLKTYEMCFPHDPVDQGSFILHRFELEEEVAYQKYLLPLWSVWGHLFHRQVFPHYSKEVGSFLSQLLFFHQAIQTQLFTFKPNLALREEV